MLLIGPPTPPDLWLPPRTSSSPCGRANRTISTREKDPDTGDVGLLLAVSAISSGD